MGTEHDLERILAKLDKMTDELTIIKVSVARMETTEARIKNLEEDVKSLTKRIYYGTGIAAAVISFISIIKEFILKGHNA